jgi:hypothetical protein
VDSGPVNQPVATRADSRPKLSDLIEVAGGPQSDAASADAVQTARAYD